MYINKFGYLATVRVTHVHAEEQKFISEFLISQHMLPTQSCLWFLAAPFSDFAWVTGRFESSEDFFFSIVPLMEQGLYEV